MNYKNLRESYAAIRKVLMWADEARTRLPDEYLSKLHSAILRTGEASDFGGVIYVYERLIEYGAISKTPPLTMEEEQLYFRYVRAQLKVREYNKGLDIIKGAVERFPNSLDMWALYAMYLWFNEPKSAISLISNSESHIIPSYALIPLIGEAEIRAGNSEVAVSLAHKGRSDEFPRDDHEFLLMNSFDKSEDKLFHYNRYLERKGLGGVQLRDDRKKFGIDNLSAINVSTHYDSSGPLVSVIMTAFNCRAFIEGSAKSILNQSYRNIELIICDDLSNDGTREVIVELSRQDPRVRPILRNENSGTYIAKSEAFLQARGEFTIFHDSDDWAHPNKIHREVQEILSEPKLLAVQSSWVRINEDAHVSMQLNCRYAHPNPAGTMLRTDPVREAIGVFHDVRTGADTEFKRRIQNKFGGRVWRTIPTALVLGRLHGDSLTQQGSSTMRNFGWSVPRALYRTSWFDRHLSEQGGKNYWAPLGVRKVPLPVSYDYDDLFKFDHMTRFGLNNEFEDFLLIINGSPRNRLLTQVHRLCMGLSSLGYKVGVFFEDSNLLSSTWQGKHLSSLAYVNTHVDIKNSTSKLVISFDVSESNDQMIANVNLRSSFDMGGMSDTNESVPLEAFCLSPNWAKHIDLLKLSIEDSDIIFHRKDFSGGNPIDGTSFSFECIQRSNYDGAGVFASSKLTSSEDLLELSMLSRYFGHKLTVAGENEKSGMLQNHSLSSLCPLLPKDFSEFFLKLIKDNFYLLERGGLNVAWGPF